MKLTVLGSGYFIPMENRNNSGYLLEIGGESLLLDTGSGSLRQLVKTGHSVWDISKIFYSHLHIDHFADILPILFTRKYSKPEKGQGKLQIFGHNDLSKFIAEFEKIFGKWIVNEDYPYEVTSLEPGHYHFDKFDIKVYRGKHADQSLMYRFEDQSGRVFLYTGDTDMSDELLIAAKNVDFLVTEFSSTNENPVSGHLSPQKINALLQKCRPKLTLLSHLTPETEKETSMSQIKVPSGCKVELAEDFRQIEI